MNVDLLALGESKANKASRGRKENKALREPQAGQLLHRYPQQLLVPRVLQVPHPNPHRGQHPLVR